MKKNFKRTMAAVMAAALTLSLAGTAAEADAAKAKKPKFASKSVTVNVGKTKTVKIKNAKKVKKLTVKVANKKTATVSKKGKTAVKVKGKKAGNTKVTATLKIKGQKKAVKLTLKVKVKKAVPPTVTTAPVVPTAAVTAAPPAGSGAPAASAPAATQPAASAPAATATAPAGPTKEPTTPPTKKPDWTPDPEVLDKVEDVSIKYDYEFPGTRVVKFDGTVVNHDNKDEADTYEDAKAEGYPEGGFDVRYYKKVIVKYEGKKLTGDGDWFGKATLSSTDEGLGQNEYADGLFLKYLNDVDTAGGYKDGVYTVEYDIDESKMVDGFDFYDAELIDCFSVQLAAEDDYAGFKLLSADFIAMDKPAKPSDTPTTAPTQKPSTDTGSVDTGNVDTGNVDTGVVETAKPAPTQDPNKVVLKNSNVAISGNLTTADGAATDKVVENADGSITFYTNAKTSGGGVHLYFDPVGKEAVDLSDYKEIKVTVKDESAEARQAVMELITSDITSWWSAKRESGIAAAYPFFGRDSATTETIDLTTAKKTDIQGIMIKYNGYKQPSDGASEAEQEACKAAFTITSVELVPKD